MGGIDQGRIFRTPFQGTSKIPTFTLLIKTNAQLHLKMLSCNFYFLKNLTDIRHIILQPARKFKNSFMEGILPIKHFFPSSISFLPNPIFLLLSFIFRFVNILGTHALQKENWQNQSCSEAVAQRCSVKKVLLENKTLFNNSLCLQYVEPNFSSIYLKASQLFCSIGVSQYSQENTCTRVFFFKNSLELQASPIKKRCSGTGVFLTIKILSNNFFNT